MKQRRIAMRRCGYGPEYLKADYGSAILFENKGGLARAEDRCKEALRISLPRPYG